MHPKKIQTKNSKGFFTQENNSKESSMGIELSVPGDKDSSHTFWGHNLGKKISPKKKTAIRHAWKGC
jgi:hypothetical protein